MFAKNFPQSGEANKEEMEIPKINLAEKNRAPEDNKEKLSDSEREHLKHEVLVEIEETEKLPPVPDSKKPVKKSKPLGKSHKLVVIERILETDLKEVYFKMDPKVQVKFKAEGEAVAETIEQLLQETKIKVKKIFKLILSWLKLIPGVNNFFIKQEAKIKTDKLIKLK